LLLGGRRRLLRHRPATGAWSLAAARSLRALRERRVVVAVNKAGQETTASKAAVVKTIKK
jgi:hypothetical protein